MTGFSLFSRMGRRRTAIAGAILISLMLLLAPSPPTFGTDKPSESRPE